MAGTSGPPAGTPSTTSTASSSPPSTLIDTAAHTARLSSGQELSYDKVLIATGGRNRRLEIPGAGLPGVHYLRTVADCEAIKGELPRASAPSSWA